MRWPSPKLSLVSFIVSLLYAVRAGWDHRFMPCFAAMEAPQITEPRRTRTEEIPQLLSGVRRTFESGRTRPLEWRKGQLRRLRAMLIEREDIFLDALREDLGKPRFEGWLAETGFVAGEIDYIAKRLARWMRPERVRTPLANQPGKSVIVREPFGVVLVIGPWNYPIQLVLSPLAGALAAGNCAVLKPSEVTPASSAALAEWLPKYLDASAVKVVEGGVDETQALLAERFDYIFYTGGGKVGRIVMEAAAKHLTPVTLELGGKSPCFVDADVDLDVAAKRIVWGKFLNAGQTCVAPDYLLVHQSVERALVDRMRSTLRTFYGDDPKRSADYARIVNDRHWRRLVGLLDEGEAVIGGERDANGRYIAPTVVTGVGGDSKVMQDEIFGPILPLLTVRDADEAVRFVSARPKPLALYVFSRDARSVRRFVDGTSSGGVCVNDVVTHLACPELPFGGVGESGMGAYHGHHSFETFSHRKAVLDKSTRVDPPVRYPPYDANKEKWARRLV
jgi:aldehyde dehydrogenase (NAD+)